MVIKVVSVDLPAAKGRIKGVRLLGEFAPCIVQMENNDELCVARLVIV